MGPEGISGHFGMSICCVVIVYVAGFWYWMVTEQRRMIEEVWCTRILEGLCKKIPFMYFCFFTHSNMPFLLHPRKT
jgi:amino acid permease